MASFQAQDLKNWKLPFPISWNTASWIPWVSCKMFDIPSGHTSWTGFETTCRREGPDWAQPSREGQREGLQEKLKSSLPVALANVSVMWVKLSWTLQTSPTASWISTDPSSLHVELKNWSFKAYLKYWHTKSRDIMIFFLKLLSFGVVC